MNNAPAERPIRPLAVGRRNWLQIAGGGATSAAVLLSVAAPAKRHARALLTSATCYPMPGHGPVRTRRRPSIDPTPVTARRLDFGRGRVVSNDASRNLTLIPQ